VADTFLRCLLAAILSMVVKQAGRFGYPLRFKNQGRDCSLKHCQLSEIVKHSHKLTLPLKLANKPNRLVVMRNRLTQHKHQNGLVFVGVVSSPLNYE
jgi:hypothetical protein